ncbi:alkaline shock response membrane anchor protein AmaP [Streptomyces sp. NPDC002643]
MLRIVNRLLLGTVGLALLLIGAAVLIPGLGVNTPSWWPYDGDKDVLLSDADRTRWRDDDWWWPTVIAVLAVLLLLALWWLTAVLRRHRLTEVLVDTGDGEGALLRGRALENVLTTEASQPDGIQRAQAHLTGQRSTPRARIRLQLRPHVPPSEALTNLTTEALAHARDSAGLATLPADVRLTGVKHRAERVT